MTTELPVLKRGDPSRRGDNDYDVLEDGKVVGRIFHLEAAAPGALGAPGPSSRRQVYINGSVNS